MPGSATQVTERYFLPFFVQAPGNAPTMEPWEGKKMKEECGVIPLFLCLFIKDEKSGDKNNPKNIFLKKQNQLYCAVTEIKTNRDKGDYPQNNANDIKEKKFQIGISGYAQGEQHRNMRAIDKPFKDNQQGSICMQPILDDNPFFLIFAQPFSGPGSKKTTKGIDQMIANDCSTQGDQHHGAITKDLIVACQPTGHYQADLTLKDTPQKKGKISMCQQEMNEERENLKHP